MHASTQPTGTMPNSSRKRKAAELDRSAESKPISRTTTGKARSKKKRKASTASLDTVPFRATCPLKQRDTKTKSDIFIGTESLNSSLTFDYAIRPGEKWKAMRSYKNVKYSDNTFTIGGIVYINKQDPPPEPPPTDASDAQILAYDRQNFWVARIADTRAANEKSVYLRVTWLYWPEELPMGRQSYHSDHELILSNAMDIVDATTISWTAEVGHWDETDMDAKLESRFWRQTLDVGQLGPQQKGGLSDLRLHCRCQQPHNPDKVMFQCKDQACGTWNHESCLLYDLKSLAEKHYRLGTLDQLVAHNVKDEHQLASPMRGIGKLIQSKIKPAMEAITEQALPHVTNGVSKHVTSPSQQKGNKTKKNSKIATELEATEATPDLITVSIVDTDDDDAPVLAKVLEVNPQKIKHEEQDSTGAHTWLLHVCCLRCGKHMD